MGHNWISANGRYSFVSFEGGRSPGVAIVDLSNGTVVQTWEYPGGGRPHGIFYDDPAATEGPAVVFSQRVVRVTPAGGVKFRIRCSALAVGFCKGRVAAVGGVAQFSLQPGRTTTVRLTLTKVAANRLAAKKRETLRASATAVDQLGNSRSSAAAITLLAPRTP